MKKSLKRAVAVSAVCAAGLAGTLTTTTTATADEARKAPSKELTDFGMKSLAFGTKVAVGGVDIKSLKDAKTIQACTRMAGLGREKQSTLSVEEITRLIAGAAGDDIAELIRISPSTSFTETYTEGDVVGTRAINTIADIKLGGAVPGIDASVPALKIQGLRAVADSFYDPADTDGDGKKFGTAESFDFQGISLDYEGTVVEDTPLADLLDIVNDTVAPVNEIVSELVVLLTDTVGQVIEIPGLGSIGLGSSFRVVKPSFASSGANALEIEINPSGEENGAAALLKLGYAQSRIAAPVKSGVFRSTIMGLDFKALPLTDDLELLHMGGIGTQSIPCEGGKATKEIEGTRTIPLGVNDAGIDLGIAKLTGLTYKYNAKQKARGRARSTSSSSLGTFEIPALDLVIEGVSSKLKLKKFPGERVRGSNKPIFKVLSIKHGEDELIPPAGLKIGDLLEFVDDLTGKTNFIEFGVVRGRNYYGAKSSALKVTIPGISTIHLGWLESQIYPK